MNLTDAMRKYAKAFLGVADNASDDAIKAALGAALLEQRLDQATWGSLREGKEVTGRQVLKGIVQEVIQEGGRTVKTVKSYSATPDPNKALAGVRVKAAGESYSTTKSVGRHVKTGQPVLHRGQEAVRPSELERAKVGVYLKKLAREAGVKQAQNWTDHDETLWREMVEEDDWLADVSDPSGGQFTKVVQGQAVKALLEDGISGGTALAPIYYDDMLIVQLLLNSEIAPYVDLQEVPVGRYVQAETMSIPTAVWGIPSGTSMPLFDTTNMIGTLGSTIYNLTCAVEVGRDLLADTPIKIGSALEDAIGQRMLVEFDSVIANGDGVSQPLGIFTTPGLAVVASANGPAGPLTVADAESLIFGLPKPYRKAALNPSFVANDIAYRRFRSIAAGSELQNLRALGFDEQSYQVLNYPFRVQNDVPNSYAAMVCLKKYRLYRRQGAESEWSKEGRSLMLANTALLTVRARFGGRLVDPAAAVVMTDLAA